VKGPITDQEIATVIKVLNIINMKSDFLNKTGCEVKYCFLRSYLNIAVMSENKLTEWSRSKYRHSIEWYDDHDLSRHTAEQYRTCEHLQHLIG